MIAYVIQDLNTGMFVKFGSYSKTFLQDHPIRASLYSTELLASKRLKDFSRWNTKKIKPVVVALDFVIGGL